MSDILTLYAVRNTEGKWFRAVGYRGGGNTWVDSLQSAKLYAKIGQARGRISFFVNKWPQFGTPDLVEIKATVVGIIDEAKRIEKVKEAHRTQKARQAAARARRDRAEAERALERAQAELRRLGVSK